MARQKAGIEDLKVDVMRAVGALRQALGPSMDNDPSTPDQVVEFYEALVKIENAVYGKRVPPKWWDKLLHERSVWYDGSDLYPLGR